MPIVTDIKRQKRSEGRFSVFVDGVFAVLFYYLGI